MQTFYSHSGKAPLPGILLTLAGGLVAGVILGIVYGFLIFWVPFIYINLFITIGFGVALGAVTGHLSKVGKIRNSTVVALLALIVALAAYYVHWVVWIERLTEQRVTDPAAMWQFLRTVADFGAWSIFGWTPTGLVLYAVWAIEALLIVGIGTFGALAVIDVPFCEQTGQWASDKELQAHFEPLDAATVGGSPGTLLAALRPMSEPGAAFSVVTVATAAGSELRCVSVDNFTVKTDKNGKEDTTKTTVVKHMLFDRDSFEQLRKLAPAAAG